MKEHKKIPKDDLGLSFSKLIDYSFVKYNGCFIEKSKRGDTTVYNWVGVTYDTLDEAKAAVDAGYDGIRKSLPNNEKA